MEVIGKCLDIQIWFKVFGGTIALRPIGLILHQATPVVGILFQTYPCENLWEHVFRFCLVLA